MPDWLKPVLEWLKESPRYILPILLASGVILFLPVNLLEPIGLDTLRKEAKPYLGFAFVLSMCVLLGRAIASIAEWCRRKYMHHQAVGDSLRHLHRLTEVEKEVLRFYLEEKTRTITWNLENGVVRGLVSVGILAPAVPTGDIFEYPFNMSVHAWEYLQAHPDLIGHDRSKEKRSPEFWR